MSRANFRVVRGRLARRLGLRVSLEPMIDTLFQSPQVAQGTHRGSIVEFVGPTCVGKSTFLRHLRLTNDENDNFSFLGERRRIRSEGSLRRRIGNADPAWKLLWELQFEATNSTSGVTRHGAVSPTDIRRHCLLREMAIRSLLTSETLLIDHSLTFFFRNYLRPAHLHDPEAFAKLMSGRCLAICTADPYINVERVEQRRSNNIPNRLHDGKSLDESLKISQDLTTYWKDFGDWFETVGVPVLRLDLGRPLQESKGILKAFLETSTTGN